MSEKGNNFLLGRMYFTREGDCYGDGYQNFLVLPPMLCTLIVDSKRKVTNSISTEISY